MYKKQRGLLPSIFNFGGLFAILCSIANFVVWFPQILPPQRITDNDTVGYLLTVPVVLLVTGLLLLSVFPEIRLTPEGLKYRVGPIHSLIKWSEIESVSQMKFDVIRIAIKRDGFVLFNGLLFQRFIGSYMRHEYPLLLLSNGLEKRDEIVQEILTHSNVKKVRLASDVYT